jgi:hypothetical protein
MTILYAPRSRIVVLKAAVTCVSALILLFASQVFAAHGAKQRVVEATSNALLAAELETNQVSTRTPVLVELFTSEGCSSCPPADALLARLLKDQPVPSADILVLEEHVDYWDSLGWQDRFSSADLTRRQRTYGDRFNLPDIYTPQMVVDGTSQLVGNDAAHALRAVAQAARAPKLALTLSTLKIDGSNITGSISSAASVAAKADVYAVLVEKAASTKVLRGENGGHTLNHVSVVRTMQRIGSLDAANRAPIPFSLTAPSDSNAANLRLILFAQLPGQGAVVGAVGRPISMDPTPPATVATAH